MLQLALLALMTAPAQSITITAPTASSDVVAGATFNITWDAVGSDDVKIDLSTDDGTSWTTIEQTVDASMTEWQSYPWLVPTDQACSACRVRISDYLSGTPSGTSDAFAIRFEADETEDDGEGGCAATPGSGLAVLLALALRRRRR